MTRCLILILVAATLHAAAPPSEPLPGPDWAVYVPLGEGDNAGLADPGRKCHWYEKHDAEGQVVGGAWYTHLVVKDGVVITDNADPAIWNGDAVLFLRPRPNNPQELEPVIDGRALGAADGYAVMRMVLVRPGQDGMPPDPVQIGSPHWEPARRANEDRVRVELPPALWVAAEECTQGLWTQLVGDLHPGGAGGHDAALAAMLAAEGIPSAEFIGHLRPALALSYGDALAFCDRAATALAARVRLPTEAEWEYACRAGRDTAFNTERGYTLRGPQWEIATTDTPPVPVAPEDYDDYFAKQDLEVRGPFDLTLSRFYVAGEWEEHLHTVRFESSGRIAIRRDFTALAEVEANFDSRYRRWYHRLYAFDHRIVDGIEAWFQVRPETLLDAEQTVLVERGRPAGMVAYDQRHLAQAVRGLFVAVDAAGAYTCDPDLIAGFRQVVDGVLPPGLAAAPGQPLVYYHQAEYDNQGIFLGAPLPDEETFFEEADEDIIAAILGLPLGDPPTTAAADLEAMLSDRIELAKTWASHAWVDWGRSSYERVVSVDLAGLAPEDKRGRYALRNRWGIANTHGNLAEWCVPDGTTGGHDPRRRWDGEAGYGTAAGYTTDPADPARPYVVLRGGSYQAGADKCRSAVRHPAIPSERRPHIGFRFVIEGE